MADGVLASLSAEMASHEKTRAELEQSRQRNRGLIARVHALEDALGQAQTLIAGAMQAAPDAVHVCKWPVPVSLATEPYPGAWDAGSVVQVGWGK